MLFCFALEMPVFRLRSVHRVILVRISFVRKSLSLLNTLNGMVLFYLFDFLPLTRLLIVNDIPQIFCEILSVIDVYRTSKWALHEWEIDIKKHGRHRIPFEPNQHHGSQISYFHLLLSLHIYSHSKNFAFS